MIAIKIPKEVAGVKIAKKIRRRAKATLKMASSPAMRELARVALRAAREGQDAGRRAEFEARRWAAEDAGERKESEEMCDTRIHIDGRHVAETFRTAAIAGLRTFLDGLEQGLKEAKAKAEAEAEAAPEAAPEPEPAAKPRRAKAKPTAGAKPAGGARGARARP